MLKKILIIFSLILLTSCEYKPIYSSANKSNYKIIVTELTGDKKLNKFIVENLTRNSEKDSNQIVNIKINTTYTKSILAKDSSGNATDYQANALTTFLIDRNLVTKNLILMKNLIFKKCQINMKKKAMKKI